MRSRSRSSASAASVSRGSAAAARKVRCAVYTRKSSEEGLEQDFNSLHAQREACESYIASQRHEGWMLIKTAYDDGGYSGGSMERPGLRKLLADIQSGLIDVVVVYKVDRLTRSLADFAKMVEAFDANSVSFVSVTQSFNTTSSMGRLTLNVLLSFAQFEREVTGERIRDKIAASKKKGLWMGGLVPVGYAADGRTLAIVEESAATVRSIFERYLALGSVGALADELTGRDIRTNAFVTRTGKVWGGKSFSRGHLYKILSNPIYVGDIVHKGERHAGQHPAIVARETFDAVQAQLADNTHERSIGGRATEPGLLAGLLFDEAGDKLFSSHATRAGRRYRYYVARQAAAEPADDAADREQAKIVTWRGERIAPNGRRRGATSAPERNACRRTLMASNPVTDPLAPLRLPAGDIERVVIDGLVAHLRDRNWLMTEVAGLDARPGEMQRIVSRASSIAAALHETSPARRREALIAVVDRITVRRDGLVLALQPTAFAITTSATAISGAVTNNQSGTDLTNQHALVDDERHDGFVRARASSLIIALPYRLEPKGRELRMILPGTTSSNDSIAAIDKPLLKAVARAMTWYDDLVSGRIDSARAIAAREGVGEAYVGQIIKLAFLAPDLVADIRNGRPVSISLGDVARGLDLPLDWTEQRRLLGR